MKSISNWQTDDISAFEAFFKQYQQLVFRTAYLMNGNKEEAEDILQDVFVTVWKSRHSFDPARGKLTTWLHRITVNPGDMYFEPLVQDRVVTFADLWGTRGCDPEEHL